MLAKVKTENTQSTYFRPVQENKDGRYLENKGPKPPVLGGVYCIGLLQAISFIIAFTEVLPLPSQLHMFATFFPNMISPQLLTRFDLEGLLI